MHRTIGIIAEYNPFHNGHLYQINQIKNKYPDSTIIVILSSSFSQRGDISILNKFEKTNVALNHGVDLIIELPYIYSTQGSDIFAKYALEILNHIKIDILCFGIESDNIENIKLCAKTQLFDEKYNLTVKEYLDKGINYPSALNSALKELINIEIKEPNDLLALSYIKEIIANNYNIEIFNIKRTSNYHDLVSNDSIISASNIRNKLKNDEFFKNSVPSDVYNLLIKKKFNDKYFELLKYKIISENNLDKYVDVDEGLSTRIIKCINVSNNIDELIKNIKTKRYTYNRISRMLNHILCSFTKDENISCRKLEYIRVLGFTEKGRFHLKKIKDEIKIPILNKYDTTYKTLEIEKRVSIIYSMIYGNIMSEEIKNKPIKK